MRCVVLGRKFGNFVEYEADANFNRSIAYFEGSNFRPTKSSVKFGVFGRALFGPGRHQQVVIDSEKTFKMLQPVSVVNDIIAVENRNFPPFF